MDGVRGDEPGVATGDTPVVTRGRTVSSPATDAFLGQTTRPRGAWITDETTIAYLGATATITATGADRFDVVRERATALFEASQSPDSLAHVARPRLYGGFAFHDNAVPEGSPWRGFDSAWFVLPEVQIVRDGDRCWLTTTASGEDATEAAEARLDEWAERIESMAATSGTEPPAVSERRRTPSRRGWREQVRAALDRVDAGELEKVVLAQSLSLTFDGPLEEPTVLERLGETYPECYRFLLTPPGAGTFFGATPERLVARDGRTVRTEALAGSTGRGDTPAEDEWLAEELLESEKDRHEHQLVVDAIREQLAPLASSVSTGPLGVRRLATVQHLETELSAELHTDDHVLSLVEALHPTPAVGGLPPDAALDTITATETFDRGWYAAPVGWFDAAGNGTFAVAIRSALSRDNSAHLFAGAGIVADSEPDREWDEVQLKYRPMLDELE